MATQVPPPGSPLAPGPMFPAFRGIQEDLQEMRRNWYWFVILGIVLVIVGIAAVSYAAAYTTEVIVLVFGYFLVVAGVFYVAGAFFTRSWGGFFLNLLAGVLHLVVGIIIIDDPIEAAIIYTLMLAVFFFVEGLFRIVTALTGRFRHQGMMLLDGIVTLILGIFIWRQWPLSGLYVIGLFLGINLIVHGVSYVTLGLTARQIPDARPG